MRIYNNKPDIAFGSLKTSQLTSDIQYFAKEKFKPPMEQFNTVQDMRNYFRKKS